MARQPEEVTDAELSILTLLWKRERATVRDLAGEAYGNGSASVHATVQKLLERLASKGFVRQDRSSWPHTFEPVVDRGDVIVRQLQKTADKLCDGSLQQLLLHLTRVVRVAPEASPPCLKKKAMLNQP